MTDECAEMAFITYSFGFCNIQQETTFSTEVAEAAININTIVLL
jgi:hypothetical protein